MVKRKVIKPRLYKTIFQARYKANLKFYGLLFPVAMKLDNYPHWSTDRLSVVLRNYKRRCSLSIKHNNFAYDQDYDHESDSFSDEDKNITQALTELPSSLEIESYNRLGFRRQYLIAVDKSFKELVTTLNLKFLSQNDNLLKIMPPEVDDLQYAIDSTDGDFHFHIRIGPVKKEEIPERILFTKQHHLDPETGQKEYFDIIQKYPDVAVFIDIDLYRVDENIPTDKALPFLNEAGQRIDTMVSSVREYIFTR